MTHPQQVEPEPPDPLWAALAPPQPPAHFRTVSLRQSVELVLDRLEALYVRAVEKTGPTSTQPRIVTGVRLIDEAFGGLPSGEATVLSFDHAVVGEALACALARSAEGPLLVACPDVERLARTLLAAASGTPYALLESGHLNEQDWTELEKACRWAFEADVILSNSTSAWQITETAASISADLVVVLRVERFATSLNSGIEEIRTAAAGSRPTMLVLNEDDKDEPNGILVRRPTTTGALLLMTPDEIEGVRTASAHIDLHSRAIT